MELHNVSSRSVRLDGWYLCDNRSCCVLPPCTVMAGGYAVVCRDTTALRESRRIGRGALLVEARLPSLNNTTDDVVLRDHDSAIVDSTSYRVLVKGRSLERVDGGWVATLARDSATCGDLNSSVVLRRDRRLASVRAGTPVPAYVVLVENRGRERMPPSPIVLAVGKRRVTDMVPVLDPGSTWEWAVMCADDDGSPNEPVLVSAWLTDADDRTANDTVDATMVLPPASGMVVVNEVFFDPQAGQADYVEIFNGGSTPIDLAGWMVADQEVGGERDTAVCLSSVRLEAGGYAVLTVDSGAVRRMAAPEYPAVGTLRRGFNLDATGDDVLLMNPSGFLVDAVRVEAAWHIDALPTAKGVSLERLAPQLPGTERTSWTSSGDIRGGTPGRQNDVRLTVPEAEAGRITVTPQPCRTADGPAQPCLFTWEQPFRHALLSLVIVTDDGIVVRTLLNAVVGGANGAIVWDGRTDAGLPVQPGPYVAVLEALDVTSSRTRRAYGIVVVGG